jgi:hypothetical protein
MIYKGWWIVHGAAYAHGNSGLMIVNRETGESVTGPKLMSHLIRTHHFLEGLAVCRRERGLRQV